MIETVGIIGARGRVGSAFSARLVERGVRLETASPEIVLLCVPDGAIADVAQSIPAGPWVGHVSGATPLDHLAPHTRRFSIHPLQTFTLQRGAEQIDGAWAGITADGDEGLAVAEELAEILGLRSFVLEDGMRARYHSGAAIASNYLVTLRRAAGVLLASAGVPEETLDPLMQRVIENGFELTGPIQRGDHVTVERHRIAIEEAAPELLEAYDALARLTTAGLIPERALS